MAVQNTDFLKFSASSIKEYITKKLSENSKFTDQVYEGSNITVLIDIISYMYQCMMYQLNNAASESMWSDTMIYENISRLARILGYSPRGIVPSQGIFYIDNTDSQGSSGKYGEITIPQYAKIDTGKIDSNGRKIFYSTKDSFQISRGQSVVEKVFYNGEWKMYGTVNTATGSDYETFILNGIGSDIENKMFTGDRFIDVYIKSYGSEKFVKWKLVDDELFMNIHDNGNNFGKIYDGDDQVYNLRLNQDKVYEIKFGNGVIGQKLNRGDQIYVFYMETNGEEGKIDANDIDTNGKALKYGPNELKMTDEMYKQMFNIDTNTIRNDILVFQNLPTSTPRREETVQEIRDNAPIWFKMGRRLITEQDYRYFLKHIIADSDLIDCAIQNNYQYMSTFYRWLYNLGLENHDNPRYYLNETKLIKSGYEYVDASDSNNIYIWTKLKNSTLETFHNQIRDSLERMKSITAEITLLEPVTVYFAVTAAPESVVKEYLSEYELFDPLNESYIEVEVDDNSIYVNSDIQQKINDTINRFFDQTKLTIGCTMNYQNLMTEIYSISGIKRVRTVYRKKKYEDEYYTDALPIIKEGISFVTWSKGGVIEEGDDMDSSNIMKSLQPFQFPQLYTQELKDKIQIIKKSVNNINKMTY